MYSTYPTPYSRESVVENYGFDRSRGSSDRKNNFYAYRLYQPSYAATTERRKKGPSRYASIQNLNQHPDNNFNSNNQNVKKENNADSYNVYSVKGVAYYDPRSLIPESGDGGKIRTYIKVPLANSQSNNNLAERKKRYLATLYPAKSGQILCEKSPRVRERFSSVVRDSRSSPSKLNVHFYPNYMSESYHESDHKEAQDNLRRDYAILTENDKNNFTNQSLRSKFNSDSKNDGKTPRALKRIDAKINAYLDSIDNFNEQNDSISYSKDLSSPNHNYNFGRKTFYDASEETFRDTNTKDSKIIKEHSKQNGFDDSYQYKRSSPKYSSSQINISTNDIYTDSIDYPSNSRKGRRFSLTPKNFDETNGETNGYHKFERSPFQTSNLSKNRYSKSLYDDQSPTTLLERPKKASYGPIIAIQEEQENDVSPSSFSPDFTKRLSNQELVATIRKAYPKGSFDYTNEYSLPSSPMISAPTQTTVLTTFQDSNHRINDDPLIPPVKKESIRKFSIDSSSEKNTTGETVKKAKSGRDRMKDIEELEKNIQETLRLSRSYSKDHNKKIENLNSAANKSTTATRKGSKDINSDQTFADDDFESKYAAYKSKYLDNDPAQNDTKSKSKIIETRSAIKPENNLPSYNFDINKSSPNNQENGFTNKPIDINKIRDPTSLNYEKMNGVLSLQKPSLVTEPIVTKKLEDVLSSKPKSPGLINKNLRGGLRGLANLGNTCFMNSIIQVLSNTKPLLTYIQNKEYLTDINGKSPLKGEIIKEFAKVISELWDCDGSEDPVLSQSMSIRPIDIKRKVESYAPRFAGYNQQDAQEFLAYLLSGFHDDLNQAPKKTLYSKRKSIESSVELTADVSWKRYQETNKSKIVDLFGGQLKSILTCAVCGHRSLAYDPFWNLSLSIASDQIYPNLYDCLNTLIKEERLEDDEAPYCCKCEKRQSSTKSFKIQRYPQILIIHIKRFAAVNRNGYESFTKVRTPVEFPFQGLDLAAFSAENSSSTSIMFPSKYLSSPDAKSEKLYNLYGITCHTGGISSGHYFSYCKHPVTGKWHLFEDSKVEEVDPSNIDTKNAYLLFYQTSTLRSE